MKHPPLLKNKMLSLHDMFIISVYIMHCITFPSIIWHALHVMDAGTAQPTVGCMTKVVQKCVCFAKISRLAI